AKAGPRSAAELLGADLDVVAIHRRREARLLQLLLHRLRLHAVDALGPYICAGRDEPGELVTTEQRLVQQAFAGYAHVFGVREYRMDHPLRIVACPKLLDRHAWVAGLRIRITLVVEVVHER